MDKDKIESEKFLELFNQLDAYMRSRLHFDRFVDHSTLLREMSLKHRIFLDYLSELRTFAEIRNMLIHNPYKKDADPLFHLHGYLLKRYGQIVDLVLNPPKALSVSIPAGAIYTATLESPIQKLMKVMIEKNFTHIPIVKNDAMIGVFSENTFLSFLIKNQEGIILKDATVGDFEDFIKLENHMNEFFEFVPRNTLLSEVEEIFKTGMKNKKRIAVVYITENGKSSEKILGMITPWDLPAEK